MKNSNYFPFERNKYFYGKLLSVDDFELEQKYMNDKRRLINQFLLGYGVAAGLNVVRIDEQTISVETGFALDSWGREIVVDVPVTKKLSLMDGFKNCTSKDVGFVYLCIEYDEQETDKVHNITGNISGDKEHADLSYSKIREGYHLFLTDHEPEENIISPSDWYQFSQVVYQEGDIKITQITPRYLQTGQEGELRICVENTGRSSISFSYEAVLNSLLSDKKAKINVVFDEIMFERTGKYELSYPLQASDTALEDGLIMIDPDTVVFRLSGVQQEIHIEGTSTIKITDGDVADAVEKEHYRTSMEKIIKDGYHQTICLARIYVIRAGDTYIIEKVENVPFKQYVSGSALQTVRFEMMRQEMRTRAKQEYAHANTGFGHAFDRTDQISIAKGTAEIYLSKSGQKKDRFFSDEIVHGLGLGRVTVVLGLEREPETGKVIYGSCAVFETDKERGADVELAACVNEEDGSFVIGVWQLSGKSSGKIKVHWTAFRDEKDRIVEKNEKRIYIKPNLLELAVRQSHSLWAVCENMVEKAVSWSVKDEGGFIDENGMYTAPNTAGVYEVIAQSVAYPQIKASVFVVVREDA